MADFLATTVLLRRGRGAITMVGVAVTPPPGGHGPSDARLKRYDHRVARVLCDGRPIGWLATGMESLLEIKGRWWQKGSPRVDGLCWRVTWSDPSRFQNGYDDMWGDAFEPEDVAQTLRDWDSGRHELAEEWFELTWLSGDQASEAWADYGWNG